MRGVVVDTSAAVAVLTSEPSAAAVAHLLEEAERRVMSAANLVELGIVIGARLGAIGPAVIERFLDLAEIEVAAVDREHASLAIEAWHRFGRGNHRAALNFGDCFTYALAVQSGWPVLCVGDDFPATDVDVVRPTR